MQFKAKMLSRGRNKTTKVNHSFRHTKMAPPAPICRLLVVALACLTVATSIALASADKQSGQTEKAAQKQPPAARLRGSDLKRNQPNGSKIETVKLAQTKRAEAATKSTARSAKAKARSKAHTRRLMRSTDNQIGINASQLTAGSQANGFAASPDSWNNPHSLVPTFVDREMGDEMVALASENEPSLELQVKALPQVNRSQLSSSAFMQSFNKDSGDNEKFQREVEQQMGGTAGARPLASRPAAALEDYYGEEEEEEDEQPAATSAKSAENRRFRGGYNYQQSAGFQLNDLVNRSRTISRPGDSLELQRKQPDSWLPTGPIQTGPQKGNSDADESSILRRPQDEAKRIVGMFGGHETVGSPLTKTDIAIEYLKNILKTKQSHQQAGVRNSSNSSDSQDNSHRKAANQSSAFYPLPVVMSDYANKKANTSEQALNPAGQPAEAMRIQQASVASIASAQHEAKFSIQDVKQQQQRLSLTQAGQAQYTLMPTSFAPSSLAPFGVTSESEHQQDRRFTSSPAPSTSTEQMIKSKPRGPVETSAVSEVLNGTPLGGDYIESLDEYPRSAQQPVAQWSKVNEANQKAPIGQGAKFGSDSLSAAASEHLNSPHKANQHFYQQQASASFSQAPHQFEQLPPQSGPIQAHSSRYFHRHPLALSHAQISHQQAHQSSLPAIVAIEETNARPEAPPARVKGAESPLPEQPLRSPSQALFEPIGEQQRQLAAEASRAPSQLPQFSSANRSIANEPVVNKVRVNPLGLEQIGEPVQQQQPIQLPPATKTIPISKAFEGPASQIVHEQQMAEPELGAPGKVYAKQEEAPEQMQHYRQLAQLPPALRELVHEQEQQMQLQQHLYLQEQAKKLHPTPHPTPHPTQALHLYQANQQQPNQQPHNEWQHQQQMQRYQVQLRQQYGELQPHYPQADYQEQKHEARQQEAHQPHEKRAKIKPTYQDPAANYAAPATAPQSIEQPAIATEHHRPPVSLDMQKPPRIVSYNYFESGEPADESREAQKAGGAHATSFQFGDSLLSSNGDVEHMLTAAELEAIQRQFLTAEHPVVPLNDQQQQQSVQAAHPEAGSEARQQLINSLRATGANISPELLGQLSSPHGHGEESLKVLASNNQETRQQARDLLSASASELAKSEPEARLREAKAAGEKKKSLIVYLNHPRSEEMSKVASSSEDSLAQLISEQTSGDPFVSAKEFDSHGLSKETKHLDVSRLRLEAAKEAQDKDGLSVVVIGDAYKYKKIVLLISSKSGGLKFIPMVKDMKR